MEERITNDHSLPLVIGVTGHRDLRAEDIPQLEKVVRQIIEELKKSVPHSPVVLLSALAEGADSLVARIALELGVRLIVPLPMPRHLYEADFASARAKADFVELLNRADNWFELPLLEGNTVAAIAEHGAARDRQYEQVGAYIVRHSHLLIALWDGRYRNLVGGTSRVVQFQLAGVPEPYAPRSSPIDTPENGPVYQIVTPRASDPETVGEPFSLQKLFPKGYVGEAERFAHICSRIDTFNRDILHHAELLTRESARSEEYLFAEIAAKELVPSLQSMRRRFAVADALAIYFQRRTQSALSQLFIFVLLAAVTFELYTHFFSSRHWILGIYLALLAGAYLWINRRAKRQDYQNKYQDYRALAEGMRVQFFWGLAGLKLSVADRYLRKQRSELDWICSAIRVWEIPSETEGAPLDGDERHWEQRLELVRRYWVADQSNFFIRAAKRDHDKLERNEPFVKALLRTGVAVSVLVTAAILLPHPWQHELTDLIEHHHRLHALLLALMSMPAIGAALLHGYIEKRALSEHAKQYSRMSVIFSNAEERLSQLVREGQYQHANDLIEELGQAALEENGDWVLLHRERPLEVPHAG